MKSSQNLNQVKREVYEFKQRVLQTIEGFISNRSFDEQFRFYVMNHRLSLEKRMIYFSIIVKEAKNNDFLNRIAGHAYDPESGKFWLNHLLWFEENHKILGMFLIEYQKISNVDVLLNQMYQYDGNKIIMKKYKIDTLLFDLWGLQNPCTNKPKVTHSFFDSIVNSFKGDSAEKKTIVKTKVPLKPIPFLNRAACDLIANFFKIEHIEVNPLADKMAERKRIVKKTLVENDFPLLIDVVADIVSEYDANSADYTGDSICNYSGTFFRLLPPFQNSEDITQVLNHRKTNN